MMKQIKTIAFRIDCSDNFDDKVNRAIACGWELKKRTVIISNAQNNETYTYIMLYAELEKDCGVQ